MKRYITAILILLLAATVISASNKNASLSEEQYKKYEANLLEGLKSENNGLRISSAFYLGEIKSEKAVIPLMKMLKDGDNEDLRIVAALSLIKIDCERSIYSVKEEAKFNSSERIRNKCEHFYNAYIMEHYGHDTLKYAEYNNAYAVLK